MVLPFAFLVLAGTAFARPKLVESLGLDVWKMRHLVAEMESSKALSSSLDRQSYNIQYVITFNQLLLNDVIAGRIELTEAAKQKWEVNGVKDFYHIYLDRISPAPGYEAKTAHDLMMQACDLCAKSEFPAVSSRLRQQYEAGYGPLPD